MVKKAQCEPNKTVLKREGGGALFWLIQRMTEIAEILYFHLKGQIHVDEPFLCPSPMHEK